MGKLLQLEYSSAIDNIVAANRSFDKGRMLVAYTGLNRNNSFISKEAFEKAIPSMYNVPVVALYQRDESGRTWGEIGEHNIEEAATPDGTKYVNLTQPVGVVPESATYNWVQIEDGKEIHEYLAIDVLLWKRQEAYQKIKDDGITSQSMEINVSDGEFENGYYKVNDFEFTAFCLLGSAEPCFESAALFTNKEQNTLKAEFSKMMVDLKDYYSNNTSIGKKEDNENMNKFEELLEKFNVKAEDVDFEYEGLSDEELEAKFAEKFNNASGDDGEPEKTAEPEEPENDDNVEPEEPEEPEVKPTEPDPENNEDKGEDNVEPEPEEPENNKGDNEDFALASDVQSQLSQQIYNREILIESIGDYEYEYSKYFMCDYDNQAKEVYYSTYEDNVGFVYYGAKYKMSGDDVIIDFDNEKRKKLIYTDYVQGEEKFSCELPLMHVNKDIKELYNKKCEELTQLNEFKAMVDDKAKEELFAKFEEQLADNESFKEIKENKDKYSVEALEKELFVLYGKVQMEAFTHKDTKKANTVNISNDFSKNTKDDPYGDIFKKYGYTMKEDK